LLASAVAWSKIIERWRAGRSAAPYEPRRIVPWGMTDAGLILAFWFLLSVGLQVLCQYLFDGGLIAPDSERGAICRILGLLAANVWTLEFGALWLLIRGARELDLGIDFARLGRDLKTGAGAFAAAVVPIFLVQAVLVHFWKSKHPLISLLEHGASGWMIALVIVSAAIVAPVVEEFLFRLVLQGALEAAEWWAASQAQVESSNSGQAAPDLDNSPETLETSSETALEGATAASVEDRVFLNSKDATPLARVLPRSMVWGLPAGVWPVTITSTLFALLHAGHGPDPIPLLLLALVLGYLYRQTHRLAPCIVLHALLNSLSLTMYWLGQVSRVGLD
jgi:membrane protease YdiL (CAAX protease family)